ncbi:MarR family transcriptional regulator [Streptosporangium sp. NBC_01639]|uniref:MarR family winged helix-turn-helix transcriptional regulator n=1 Tax=unclassified Streptosporangium TaxID=2632669 RepID=UPI002DD9BFF0|nr:MarR family transcriptional regulator [Streptosporangium sp. NBC_01756]WSC87259.1 MarR family transcriptional regulator [Streptosporangium sp. NBC_01756]WTD54051.1 MarR family transcriptional regulator [Streptosporangium sp. NBC_01639]
MTDDLAESLSTELRHLVLLLRRAAAGQPVTSQQSAVLGSLERGPRRMTELAEEHGVQLPTMTVQINRLEEPGLVARGTDPADARVRTVELTQEGRTRLVAVRRARIAYLTERLEALTAEELAAIGAALPALAKLGRS